ncbi:hypothetical protein C6P40_000663 [Pichia californica]|uniref:Sm domain-containing protein n=1 Tax=Pichia californica TaxID=460514 RepID=A0A9P6WKJ6_9ASCO|nr:hypothetical protein C6P42_000747 [[Candida] californica]KAG0688692.1 hypothetical protein C6P40_000663 [[Candida] californica]
MLPLYLLNAVKGETVVVELKNGGIVNGTLENCDSYMNVTLISAYASLEMDKEFHKIDRIYIRGTTIRLFKMGNEFIEKFKEQQQREKDNSHSNHRNNNNNYHNNNRQFNNNNNNNYNRQNRYSNNNNNNNNRRNGSRNYNNNNNNNQNRWVNNNRQSAETTE